MKDLLALPEDVVDVFGYALYLAQIGRKHDQARPMKGFGSAGVLEIVEDWEGSPYRAVYAGRFEGAVFCPPRVSEEIHARHRHAEV